MNIKQLNQEFAIKGHVEFISGQGGFAVAKIHNKLGSAIISLYGAHVQSFIPASQKELLWMSPESLFEKGKPIRGGIPVCFPWFGPHATDSSKPLHGFARINDWKVNKTDVLADGSTLLLLTFVSNRHTLQIWPYKFEAQINLIVGKTLELTLTYKNTGSEAFVCSDALHSYLNISDITKIGIVGLDGHYYYWGSGKEADNRQAEEKLVISREENRRYINHSGDCLLSDDGWKRNIRVAKHGSRVTVVWNPWIEASKTMGDLPDDGYQTFVCIEAANTYDDSIMLHPGEDHSITAIMGVE
jgi:glucose-6-phosphate 1-epimerase